MDSVENFTEWIKKVVWIGGENFTKWFERKKKEKEVVRINVLFELRSENESVDLKRFEKKV